MNTEYEVKLLNINKTEFINKISLLGATHVGDYDQKRYVYDLIPVNENKWIRLRTNGIETTLTIKEINNRTIDGTKELEIVVDDFNKTNLLLEQLGFKNKGYQENKRSEYLLDDIHIDIDTWPMIPTYVELEGLNKESILIMLNKLGYQEEDAVALAVADIYTKYGYDGKNLTDLKFEMEENK